MRCGRVIVELAGIGRRGKVAGEQSNSGRDAATKLARSRGYIDKVSCMHCHHADA